MAKGVGGEDVHAARAVDYVLCAFLGAVCVTLHFALCRSSDLKEKIRKKR